MNNLHVKSKKSTILDLTVCTSCTCYKVNVWLQSIALNICIRPWRWETSNLPPCHSDYAAKLTPLILHSFSLNIRLTWKPHSTVYAYLWYFWTVSLTVLRAIKSSFCQDKLDRLLFVLRFVTHWQQEKVEPAKLRVEP